MIYSWESSESWAAPRWWLSSSLDVALFSLTPKSCDSLLAEALQVGFLWVSHQSLGCRMEPLGEPTELYVSLLLKLPALWFLSHDRGCTFVLLLTAWWPQQLCGAARDSLSRAATPLGQRHMERLWSRCGMWLLCAGAICTLSNIQQAFFSKKCCSEMIKFWNYQTFTKFYWFFYSAEHEKNLIALPTLFMHQIIHSFTFYQFSCVNWTWLHYYSCCCKLSIDTV